MSEPKLTWYERNREYALAKSKRRYEEKRESILAYSHQHYQSNKQAYNESSKQWRLDNAESWSSIASKSKRKYPGKRCAESAKRRASKLQQTPAWANDFFIEEIYDLAQRRSKLTGVKWEVDHYYPLNGKTVCGLHCEINLRVITKDEHKHKGNKHPEA